MVCAPVMVPIIMSDPLVVTHWGLSLAVAISDEGGSAPATVALQADQPATVALQALVLRVDTSATVVAGCQFHAVIV